MQSSNPLVDWWRPYIPPFGLIEPFVNARIALLHIKGAKKPLIAWSDQRLMQSWRLLKRKQCSYETKNNKANSSDYKKLWEYVSFQQWEYRPVFPACSLKVTLIILKHDTVCFHWGRFPNDHITQNPFFVYLILLPRLDIVSLNNRCIFICATSSWITGRALRWPIFAFLAKMSY